MLEGEEQRLTDSNRITDTGNQERLTQDNAASNQQATDSNRIETTGEQERFFRAMPPMNSVRLIPTGLLLPVQKNVCLIQTVLRTSRTLTPTAL